MKFYNHHTFTTPRFLSEPLQSIQLPQQFQLVEQFLHFFEVLQQSLLEWPDLILLSPGTPQQPDEP